MEGIYTREDLPVVSQEIVEGFSYALKGKRMLDYFKSPNTFVISASPALRSTLSNLERDLETFKGHTRNHYMNPKSDNPFLAEYFLTLFGAIEEEDIEDFGLITPSEMIRDGFFITYKLLKNQMQHGNRNLDSRGLPLIEEYVATRTLSTEFSGPRESLEEMNAENPNLYKFGVEIMDASSDQSAPKEALQGQFCAGFSFVLELLRRQQEMNRPLVNNQSLNRTF